MSHQGLLRRVFADLEVFEQGLESLRPLQAFALREIHRSEVSGRRRVRKDLPKLSERAGDRRRFAENLFLCVRIGLDDVQQRRAPRRYSRCQERPEQCQLHTAQGVREAASSRGPDAFACLASHDNLRPVMCLRASERPVGSAC